jgi:hypothetical protein
MEHERAMTQMRTHLARAEFLARRKACNGHLGD